MSALVDPGTNASATSNAASALPIELRVLTLNVWGLKWISAHRVDRLHAIAQVLSGTRPSHSLPELHNKINEWDLVCLQEVWVPSEAQMLAQAAQQSGLAYWRHFRSGAIGSGLLICGRHPITSSSMRPYRLNGHPLKVWEGDWFVGKGIASVVLDFGDQTVELLSTHLYAPRGDHRLVQVWELAAYVRASRERGRPVILCGDLNAQPDSLELRLIRGLTDLTDSWPAVKDKAATALEALQHGVTSNSPLGTYTSPSKTGFGKKLDYVLTSPEFNAVAAEVAFTGRTDQGHTFSDHFGVSAVLRLGPTSAFKPPQRPTDELKELLHVVTTRLNKTYSESHKLLAVFGLCLGVSVASPIAASFQPLRYLNWIWPLLSSTAGILGTLGLVAGFVGAKWEEGALQSAKMEVEERLTDAQQVS